MHTATITATYGTILTAMLAITIAKGHRTNALTAERIAAAHAAGYREGLTHAALGLLNQPSTRIDNPTHDAQRNNRE